jgi:hypothetical protein
MKVQVIFMASFPSIHALLTGFDFNNCQFAVKGNRLYATSGALSYLTNRVIWYHNPERKTMKDFRMKKYAQRPYNKIVHVDSLPPGCYESKLVDYVEQKPGAKEPPKFGTRLTLSYVQ